MGVPLIPVDELNHFYKNTYLSILDKDVYYPFNILEFRMDNINGIIALGSRVTLDNSGNYLWTPATVPAENIEYFYPELNMVNVGKVAYFITRSPERQYKKGLVMEYIRMLKVPCITETIYYMHNVTLAPEAEIQILHSIYNPKYYAPDEIVRKLEELEIYSGAFSKYYAITCTDKHHHPLIMYKNITVGWIEGGVAFIPKNNEHLYESLSEYMNTEIVNAK